MAGEVVFAHYLQSDSPTLTGTVGSASALLKAVLVDGFGSIDVTSIVVASEVATVTTSTNNNLIDAIISGYLPMLVITGTGDAAVDGRHRVKTIFSTSVFEFECPGAANGSYTNGLSFKRAPLGWTTIYDVAGKTVFRNNETTGSGLYLECLDDNSGGYATANMARTNVYMQFTSDPYSLSDQVGQTGRAFIAKSSSADTTQRPWVIIGDYRSFYFFSKPGQSSYPGSWLGIGFGDVGTFGTSKNVFVQGYKSIEGSINSNLTGVVQSIAFVNGASTQDFVHLWKNYNGTQNNIQHMKRGAFGEAYVSGSSSAPVNPDADYLISTVMLLSATENRYAGIIPGFYAWPHAGNLLGTYAMFPAVIAGKQKTMFGMVLASYNVNPMYIFDLYGPWEY